MFSISVCMIVKNEEKSLERILKCVSQFADELIIVDTGSTDSTTKIAKKYTEKVFFFQWVDDFSKARNFSFSKATCDYQMWLDADDVITTENIEKINQLKNTSSKDVDVYMFKYSDSFNEENRPSFTFFRERLLKREDNFKWQGFVHEVIAPMGKIEYVNIEIQHRKISVNEPKRNLKLYQKALQRGVIFSPRELYYYARELYYNNYIDKAISILKKFLAISGTYPPDNCNAHILLSDCYLLKNKKEKALQPLFDAVKLHFVSPELCCKIANVFDLKNEKENAVFWYKTALSCPKQTLGFVNKDYEDIIPFIELSKLLYKSDYQSAKQYHKKAQLVRPNHPSVIFNSQFF